MHDACCMLDVGSPAKNPCRLGGISPAWGCTVPMVPYDTPMGHAQPAQNDNNRPCVCVCVYMHIRAKKHFLASYFYFAFRGPPPELRSRSQSWVLCECESKQKAKRKRKQQTIVKRSSSSESMEHAAIVVHGTCTWFCVCILLGEMGVWVCCYCGLILDSAQDAAMHNTQ